MTDFSTLLNPEQCVAATAGDGPLLVLAAAGTGKTRTLVHRVAYLIEQGIPAERILLLTFTNRAAREMIERAEKVVGPEAAWIWSGTFHSVCARFLRMYGGELGYGKDFQIIDEEDQKKLIGDIIKANVSETSSFPKKDIIAKIISEAANESLDIRLVAARWQTKAAGVDPDKITEIANIYAARKRELNAMDFDDLLINGLSLLKTKDHIRELLQERFLHVLVDEYQDTNGLQAEFTDILAAKHRNIMAVGDDFQCIYTWRGAQIENIMEFPKRWEGCKIVKLERNYRSVKGILDVANAVMKDAENQFDKQLRPYRQDSNQTPWIYRVGDSRVQAREVLKIIDEMRSCGYRYNDIAILYRSHFHSIDVQLAIAKARIPFRITSGVGVFEQIHTKDILAYLRLVVNPNDELSFLRFVSLLPGVGEKSARKYWGKLGHAFDVRDGDKRDSLGGMLGAKAKPIWPEVSACLERAGALANKDEAGLLISDFVASFYQEHLHREWEEEEAEDRLEDIQELAAQISASDGGLKGFLADVALLTNLDVRKNSSDSDRVTLSTIHQAKGMEWPIVIVPWLSAGMFPSQKAVDDGRGDEERRLFYVVVTRAKDHLYMFSPKIRRNPDGGMYPVSVSSFLREIPLELVQVRRVMGPPDAYGAYNRPSYSTSNYHTTWRR